MNEFVVQKGDFTYVININQVSWSTSHSLDVRLRISQKKIETILELILGKQRHKKQWDEISDVFTKVQMEGR
jgi:hypothetical protein